MKLKFVWRLLNLPCDNIYRRLFILRFFNIMYRKVLFAESPTAQIINVCIKYNILDTVIDYILSGTIPAKSYWYKFCTGVVNDRQLVLSRRSLKMYANLKLYRIVSTKYSFVCWIDICKTDRYLYYACFTMIKLLCNCSCLRASTKHERSQKVCRLCPSGSVEDVRHFVINCTYFENTRLEMITKIENCLCEESKNLFITLSNDLIFYILLGMDYNFTPKELYNIRKIAVNTINRMYKVRYDLKDQS